MPLVSVIIPVFNASDFLREAVQSILEQSFNDFELILIDDCSSDDSVAIIKSFKDTRIIFIELTENIGIAGALNSGLELAKGKYILRMDADDIALPDRIKKQIEYMERHPLVGVSGTLAEYLDGSPFNNAVDNDFLKPSLLLHCPFAHPTVIIRKSLFVEYKLKFKGYLEDYELWIKLSEFTEFGLLPEILLKYRRSENQFTNQNLEKRTMHANKLRCNFAENWLKRTLSTTEELIINEDTTQHNQPNISEVIRLCNDFIIRSPWQNQVTTKKVVKKLFLNNFYRSSSAQQNVLSVLICSFLSPREKGNILKKIIKRKVS